MVKIDTEKPPYNNSKTVRNITAATNICKQRSVDNFYIPKCFSPNVSATNTGAVPNTPPNMNPITIAESKRLVGAKYLMV